MLGIYGMGERKYEKYGAAFFSVIDAYRADHPDAVLSLDPPAPEPEKPLPSEKKKKPSKAERPAFYLTAEDARSFNYQDSYTGAELKAALIEAAGDPDVKAPTIKGDRRVAAGAAAHRHGASADEGLLLRADPCRCGRRSAQRGQGSAPAARRIQCCCLRRRRSGWWWIIL